MNFKPPRAIGLVIGSMLLAISLGGIGYSLYQIASRPVSPTLGIWTSLAVICFPAALFLIYRLYGLLTCEYIFNRDGFYLRWGISTDQIPIAAIISISLQTEYPSIKRPKIGFWWPGCMVGEIHSERFGLAEFFATSRPDKNVVIHLPQRLLVISPPDVSDFIQSFNEVVQMGSLEDIPERSQRPDFFSARLWVDRNARGLILLGLLLILILLAYLAYRVFDLPPLVPFGYDHRGLPDLFVPPARLLLLPLVGGAFWLADLLVGAWLYRRDQNRPIAYMVWALGVLLGGLLWVAVINLITAI